MKFCVEFNVKEGTLREGLMRCGIVMGRGDFLLHVVNNSGKNIMIEPNKVTKVNEDIVSKVI